MDDFLTRSKRRAGYLGLEGTPQEMAREFGGRSPTERVEILEQLDNGSDDPIDRADMAQALDKRRTVELLKRTHFALQRGGR
ncbi:hypothetical protein [Bradyrhizobium sp. ORS 86]|uniref:hypothetical protein n=1 Tax=Bradyrhizobium sp. ORS 86 TaxID=1685970 RepID=UPI00388D0BBA